MHSQKTIFFILEESSTFQDLSHFPIKAMYDLSDPYLTDRFFSPSQFHINWDIKFQFWVIR